jgi:hypothetical protein
MIEKFIQVRSIITFIEEEVLRVSGSNEIKKEIVDICKNISDVLGKIGEIEELEIVAGIKKESNGFDEIIKRIENDNENQTLYMLLISHVSDIRFLFLSKEEQEKILKEFNNK